MHPPGLQASGHQSNQPTNHPKQPNQPNERPTNVKAPLSPCQEWRLGSWEDMRNKGARAHTHTLTNTNFNYAWPSVSQAKSGVWTHSLSHHQ